MLSFHWLSYESITTPSSSCISYDPSKFDVFFVVLNDAHYIYEFEENSCFFSKGRLYSLIQFVGGTYRAFLVIIKESLLYYRNQSFIIDSYVPVPLLGRIHPAKVKALANQWSDSPLLNWIYLLLPEYGIPQTFAVHSFDGTLKAIPALSSEEITHFLPSFFSFVSHCLSCIVFFFATGSGRNLHSMLASCNAE